ncbi:hypothetical protein SAMN05216348_102109 [Olsenella sp. KH3B4]|uniref:hypothetical protein n=1 Tax=Olsenella sp. KH3B4 TaxID=1855394 RepID=UPI0008C27F2E|nr:hypothetical protein [Olsenella sp. KH3B4]SES72871.1 hypothetical protein SAMN05216348_102109 [Olsenella sp. KH3B4]
MEDKLLKLAGGAFAVFIGMAVAFQIAEQLGTFARAIACAAGIGVMVGLPICVLRTFFGADAHPRPGTWGGLVTVVAVFAFSLLFYGMSGQLDGSAAAAMVLLPGFVTLLGILRG